MARRNTRKDAAKDTTINGDSTNSSRPTSIKRKERRVFLFNEDLLVKNKDNLSIVQLRNPSTGAGSRYIIEKNDKKLYEIYQFSEAYRSWFINESLSSNGQLYLTTLIDPLFICLYYCKLNCTQYAIPIADIFKDDDFEYTDQLQSIINADQLSILADRKGDPSLNAFKYNEQKALIWLEMKCKNLALYLQTTKECNVELGAVSASFVKSEKLKDNKNDTDVKSGYSNEHLLYAFGIISDYLSKELSVALSLHLGLQCEQNKKRKSLHELENPTLKRVKSMTELIVDETAVVSETIVTEVVKEKKMSGKQKALAKAATGMKIGGVMRTLNERFFQM